MLSQTITDAFVLPGRVDHVERFGNGLINDTYRVTTTGANGSNGDQFILQRINHHVFNDPASLMRNVERICRHLNQKLADNGDAGTGQQALSLVPTRHDGPFHHQNPAEHDDSDTTHWRCFRYIDNCTSHDVVDSPDLAYQAARQFGEFQRLVADLDGERLVETIPDFHNTPARFTALKSAMQADPLGRAATCQPEIRFALENEAIAHRLLELHRRGLIPERITHNDTKISNVLICNQSKKGVCVVDLDTVMPGLSLYDFGDLMRTCLSPVLEDSTDLAAIEVRMNMFEALAEGFLDAMADILTPAEHENLAFAGILLTYEVGLRFLTDHLLGDPYFGAKHPGHNLERARNQFELVRKIQASEPEMNKRSA